MDMDITQLLVRLQQVEAYQQRFATAFASPGITSERVGLAIAAFEATLISRNAPFDRYAQGDAKAMSVEAQRGMALFVGKANCIACHSGPNFTNESFHRLGLKSTDRGRAAIQPGATMEQAFKTPGLRNSLLTAPYMHDGSQPSLEAVIRFYNRGGDVPTPDPLIKPLHLDEREIADLLAFLGALTDPLHIERPVVP
jgi:cytochrome c peroxidase